MANDDDYFARYNAFKPYGIRAKEWGLTTEFLNSVLKNLDASVDDVEVACQQALLEWDM